MTVKVVSPRTRWTKELDFTYKCKRGGGGGGCLSSECCGGCYLSDN